MTNYHKATEFGVYHHTVFSLRHKSEVNSDPSQNKEIHNTKGTYSGAVRKDTLSSLCFLTSKSTILEPLEASDLTKKAELEN